jgi:hypothetical protein
VFFRKRDRSNIGNAKVAGMSEDLDLVGLKYNIAAAVFFVRSQYSLIVGSEVYTFLGRFHIVLPKYHRALNSEC